MTNLLALHRYYIWANRLREHFDIAVAASPLTDQQESLFADDQGLFLSHWYAALYVVVEGWQELKLTDTEIDTLLSSPNIDLLHRFRNGVCHYQRNYSDPRFLNLMQAQGVVPWVRQLNFAYGRYFLSNLVSTAGATQCMLTTSSSELPPACQSFHH
jgi:hypothetical protein